MSNYDFAYLSSFDFEILVRDLLQKEFSITLESFKSGRDKGIDLRYAKSKSDSLIVQCKHYAGSTVSTLISHLKSVEQPKVQTLKPSRYIIATSLGLTPKNKEDILAIFQPHCLGTSDVIGKTDVNNLLGKFPDIERKNFKLWLTSQAVLDRVLHNAIFTQTDIELENIQKKLKYYVQNESYVKARKILDEQHSCIIAGIPGIGKTTLAEILIVDHLARDYELVKVMGNFRDAVDLMKPSKKQLFYYDDFLGQNTLEQKFGKNEEQSILDFIDAIGRSKSSRLILTTREYILNQARQNYEKLDRRGLEAFKCIINLSNYTRYEKAKILYNHVYFSGLPAPYINALIKDRSYLQIIDHRNFNPRIIEWMTDYLKEAGTSAETYLKDFVGNLNNPTKLWEHAFHNQISNSARHLMLVLATLPSEVLLQDLEIAFNSFYRKRAGEFGFPTFPGDFKKALKELDGNFLKAKKFIGSTVVEFHNPSIRDFLKIHLATNTNDVRGLLEATTFFDQVVTLWNPSEIEGPSLKQTLKQLPDELWGAIKNNYLSADCRLANTARTDGQIEKTRQVMSLETRISFVLGIEREAYSEMSSSTIRQLLETELSRIKDSRADKDALLDLLVRLKQEGDWRGAERNDFLRASIECFYKDTDDLDGFNRFVEFEDKFPDFVDQSLHKEVASQFSSFLAGELEYLRYEADDCDLIRDSLFKIDQIASAFEIKMKGQTARIVERMDELYERASSEERYGDYEHDYPDREDSSNKDETNIDGLFGSLGQ